MYLKSWKWGSLNVDGWKENNLCNHSLQNTSVNEFHFSEKVKINWGKTHSKMCSAKNLAYKLIWIDKFNIRECCIYGNLDLLFFAVHLLINVDGC